MSNQTNSTPVALVCSECGQGRYYRFFNLSPIFECEECGHGLTAEDVDLEQGEAVTITANGALAYLPATEDHERQPIARHRFSVGDELTIMDWKGNTYSKVTVTAVNGLWITVREVEDGWERGYNTSLLSVLAGQAAAHHGRGPETPGVGVIYPAAGGAHGITNSGVCIVCKHH